MRFLVVAIALSLVFTQAGFVARAAAGERAAPVQVPSRAGLPHVRRGVSYPQARAALIRQGFRPVAIAKRPENDADVCFEVPALCRRYPEVQFCTTTRVDGDVVCVFLYARRRDGRFMGVGTRYQLRTKDYRFNGLGWNDALALNELRDVTFADPGDEQLLRAQIRRNPMPPGRFDK